jgi:hypothetical protein
MPGKHPALAFFAPDAGKLFRAGSLQLGLSFATHSFDSSSKLSMLPLPTWHRFHGGGLWLLLPFLAGSWGLGSLSLRGLPRLRLRLRLRLLLLCLLRG